LTHGGRISMESTNFHSEYISGIRIDESFGKYRLSCKIGSYCEFGFDQISNQAHFHDCYELCVAVKGNGSFLHNDTKYKISEGEILISDPDFEHEIRSKTHENLILLYIFITISENHRITGVRTYEDEVIENFLSGHKFISNEPELLSYIRFIEDYGSGRKNDKFGIIQALKSLIIESLSSLTLYKINRKRDIDITNTFEYALDYIDANLHTKIIVGEVADNSLTSLRNLEYLFRKNFNKTVKEYINEKKCELACHYLSMYYSVSETAQMTGIKSVSQFGRMFKKHKGVTPQDFRKKNIGDGKGMGRRI